MKKTFHGKDSILRLGANQELGASRGLTLDLTKDTIDVTTRDDAKHGFTDHEGSWKTWSISTDGLYVADSETLTVIRVAYFDDEKIPASIVLPDGSTFSGRVIVTTFPIDTPYDDAVTFSTELQGCGALDFTPGTGIMSVDADNNIGEGLKQLIKKEKGE
jgi:TP901-1 family phage major tail protein